MTQKSPPPAAQAERPSARFGQRVRPVLSLREQLDEIEQMRKRLNEYVDFMRQVDQLQSSSTEAKETAIAAFHERMTVLEKQLRRIHDELQLG